MINTVTENLERIRVLTNLPIADYTDATTGPYYSSIGCHVRHILDVFACLINGFEKQQVDLTQRIRGVDCEHKPEAALVYLEHIKKRLSEFTEIAPSTPLELIDDLGNGKLATPATLGAVLFQAHSHAIHHLAIIGYLLHRHQLELPDAAFGYNPTTPQTTASDACQTSVSNASI